MAPTPRAHWEIQIQKQAFWRGRPHIWNNRYIMSGPNPTAAQAVTVINALHDIENAVYGPQAAGAGVGFVRGKAYPAGLGSYFASVLWNDTEAPATATGFTGHSYSGLGWGVDLENCLDIRMPLTGLSSRGKPVYVRKFFRGFVSFNGANTTTPIPSTDRNYIAATVLPWQTGMGANNWVVIGKSGRQASGPPQVEQYIGAHQVPRGRRKPKSATTTAAFNQGVGVGIAAGAAAAGGTGQGF